MKKLRTKKYPIFTYLCYLIVVSLLFTGVTFSRYSITTSGGAQTGIAGFNCSYTIDNISSLNFYNSNYWLDDVAIGTARTVRYTLNNYVETTGRISDVAVQGSIKLYLPAELADNFALQVETVSQTSGETISTGSKFTPQIVMSELLFGTYEGGNGTEGEYKKAAMLGGHGGMSGMRCGGQLRM